MKSLIEKFSENTSRFELLILSIPFILWLFCFLNFFNGKLWLQADAISYAQHIGFYTDNLSKGIYPLWDPAWCNGAPYDFFLRRIGDVNPLLALIIGLKWLGVPSATAYLIFLAFYYFLGAWAFYLITRFLLKDHFYAFAAYILFLFSSWGSEIFYNYIIIIFVPIIWFFYFLLKFSQEALKGYFLGICLCLGLIVTTYIPFFFLTILALFTCLYVLFYNQAFITFLKHIFTFIRKNIIFTALCTSFLLIACVPGIIFYKESKGGEFVLPNRHLGADTSSAVAVGLDNVESGDIISHGYFDRIFSDHAHIDMGDIYIPFIFYLLLLSTVFVPVNKLVLFLTFNILGFSLVTITSAGGIHQFLYKHIIIFKFIRNIYYFFWFGMLPMGILLFVSAFKSLLTSINDSQRRFRWLLYIITCHLVFAGFLCTQQGVLWGAWVAVFISLIYFLVYFYFDRKVSYLAGFCLFLLAVFIQSVQVYGFLDKKLYQAQDNERKVVAEYYQKKPKPQKMTLYYATSWYSILVNYIDPQVLDDYLKKPFIIYDNVVPYVDNTEFFKTLQSNMSSDLDIAYVSKFESTQNDWAYNQYAQGQADTNPVASGELSVVRSDANSWTLKLHLQQSRFLVINDNYNTAWHAFINGKEARLLRANAAFKGLWVPSGESTVFLRYSSPRRYVFHLALIALFVAVFVCLLVFLKKKK